MGLERHLQEALANDIRTVSFLARPTLPPSLSAAENTRAKTSATSPIASATARGPMALSMLGPSRPCPLELRSHWGVSPLGLGEDCQLQTGQDLFAHMSSHSFLPQQQQHHLGGGLGCGMQHQHLGPAAGSNAAPLLKREFDRSQLLGAAPGGLLADGFTSSMAQRPPQQELLSTSVHGACRPRALLLPVTERSPPRPLHACGAAQSTMQSTRKLPAPLVHAHVRRACKLKNLTVAPRRAQWRMAQAQAPRVPTPATQAVTPLPWAAAGCAGPRSCTTGS